MAFVVHLHNHEVLTVLQQIRHVEVERCEATDMVSSFLAVHIHIGIIVHGSEVEQRASPLLRVELETLLQPHGPLVEEQPFVLCVPVARYLHGLRLVEVVLDQILRALGLGIAEESPVVGIHAIVVVALLLHIDDVVPCTVKARGLSSQDVRHLRYLCRPSCHHRSQQQDSR